MKKHEEEH